MPNNYVDSMPNYHIYKRKKKVLFHLENKLVELGPERLLFFSKLEKVTRRREICVEIEGYRCHGGHFADLQKTYFLDRLKKL